MARRRSFQEMVVKRANMASDMFTKLFEEEEVFFSDAV